MNKKERIAAAIKGLEVDQVPYGFWTHLPGIDLDPDELAKKTYEFYKENDIDFIKTMNNGMYSIEDFACTIDYSEIKKGGVAKLVSTPINSIEDWKNIKATSPDEGALARELDSLAKLVKLVKGEAPIIFTVFSPITTAEKLSKNKLLDHINKGYDEDIHRALKAISETTQALIKKAIEIGIDGIFFACQTTSYDKISEELYLEFGQPYDIEVLESASSLWFNTIHVHGNNIMFDLLRTYPVDVFNWHAWETLPDVDEAIDLSGKCIMAGLGRMDITNKNKNNITNQIYQTIKKTEGRKLILTPGCVIRYPIDNNMFKFIQETKTVVEKSIIK